MHSKFVRNLLQFRLPFPRRKRLLVEVVKSAAIPQRASRNPKTLFVTAQRDRVGCVGLELDRIGAGVLGSAKNPYRLIEVLIVIGGEFSNDTNWLAASYLPASELERLRKLCFGQNSLPCWVFQLQPG